MESSKIEDEINEINNQYQELEKLLIEYAEPFNTVEKAIRDSENDKIRAEYEEERQIALSKVKAEREDRERKMAEESRERADLLNK